MPTFADSIVTNVNTLVTNVRDRYSRPNSPGQEKIPFPKTIPGQSGTRGKIIPMVDIGQDCLLDRAVFFQFNPEEIRYSKTNNWGNHQRLGFAYEIPFWVSGGAKTISFTLMMDATASSNYRHFRSRSSNDSNSNPAGSEYLNLDDYYASGDAPGSLGLLPEIEKLEALQYPINRSTGDLVSFKNGFPDILSLKQFSNSPFVVFSYGSVSAVCFVSGLERRDMLFNKELNPIRAEFSVTLNVHEAKVVNTNFLVQPQLKPIPPTSNDTRRIL